MSEPGHGSRNSPLSSTSASPRSAGSASSTANTTRVSTADPGLDRGTPRQLGEWGTPGAAAAAAGASTAQLDRWRADAEAAGVTVLHGERRLWHRTATATWWAALSAVDAPLGRRTHRDNRAEQARLLRTAGMPVAAIAAQLGARIMTIRRDLRATPTDPWPVGQ
jgi:hypothetical protein